MDSTQSATKEQQNRYFANKIIGLKLKEYLGTDVHRSKGLMLCDTCNWNMIGEYKSKEAEKWYF